MSTTTKTVKTADEKVAERDAKILQLQKEKKKILQQQRAKDRKERTSRLIRRQAQLEAFMKDLATITDDQYEAFIRTHISTNSGRGKLTEIIGKGAEAASAYIAKCRSEDEARAKAEAEAKEQAEAEISQHGSDNGSSAKPPQAEQS